MLVIDLDGTLLKEDKTVSDENAEAIRRAHAHGVTIVLATGRPSAPVACSSGWPRQPAST